MELITAEALILDVQDLGERDRLVTWITREHGLTRGAARSARSKHSRFAGQLQPLAKISATWAHKDSWQLARLSGAELVRSADFLHHELEGILLGEYLAEHTSQFATENEVGVLPFRLLDSTLDALREGVPPLLAARFFEVWMLRIAGIFPPLEPCASCGRSFADPPEPECAAVLVAESGFVCRRGTPGPVPAGAATLGPAAVAFLEATVHTRLPELAAAPPSPATLAAVETACAQVRRAFLQYELKSYLVMEKTLRGLEEG